jgi:hypothetical protein
MVIMMSNNQDKLLSKISAIQRGLLQQNKDLSVLYAELSRVNSVSKFDFKNNAEVVYKLALETEMLINKSRDVVLESVSYLEKNKTSKSAYNNIENGKYSDVFKKKITPSLIYFRFPMLTPKYSRRQGKYEQMCDYSIRNYIKDSLSEHQSKHGYFNIWDKFTIIFIHHFDGNSEICDTDNFDIKKPIDALINVLIKDDGVNNSHIIQYSKQDNANYTEMYIAKGHNITAAIDRNLPHF